MKAEGCDFMESLSNVTYSNIREVIVNAVLATDM